MSVMAALMVSTLIGGGIAWTAYLVRVGLLDARDLAPKTLSDILAPHCNGLSFASGARGPTRRGGTGACPRGVAGAILRRCRCSCYGCPGRAKRAG
jgi:hypothetical protein